jgi:hypothetical protein
MKIEITSKDYHLCPEIMSDQSPVENVPGIRQIIIKKKPRFSSGQKPNFATTKTTNQTFA